jgi:hypothetical protein
MSNLLAGLIGAVIGLAGVVAGAWLQGRKEHQRWLRDQKLHAAIDYISATGDLHDSRGDPSPDADPAARRAPWARARDGRSALYLLGDASTVEVAEALIARVRHTEPKTGDARDDYDETVAMLRDLVRRLRAELGTGG